MFTMMYQDLGRAILAERQGDRRHGIQSSSLRIGAEARRAQQHRPRR